jgi:transcriptional regulator with XRE-family HTH domain
MSGLKLLKSYNFTDKDPVIDKMRSPVRQSELSYAQISEKSGVSASTIYNWFEGTTKRPQYATVVAVMRVLGYKEAFVKKP